MTLFTGTQIADLTTRSGDVLDLMKRVVQQDASVDVAAAVTGLHEIPVRYGRAGAAFAIRAWCDRFIETTGHERGRPVQIAYASPDHTEMVDRQFILPERQWASDVLAARFADDHVKLYALLDQVADDEGLCVYLFRLAEIVAGLLVAHESPPAGPIKPGLHPARAS